MSQKQKIEPYRCNILLCRYFPLPRLVLENAWVIYVCPYPNYNRNSICKANPSLMSQGCLKIINYRQTWLPS